MEALRVLVIEDDETARKQMAKAIRKEGYQVLTAEDGREGLDIFEKERPEIVITDLKMPGIGGLEVMQTVKRLSPNVQVVLITAFGGVDTAILALREGVLDYLTKPLDLDHLTVVLGRASEKVEEFKEGDSFPTLLLADDDEKTRKRLAKVLKDESWIVMQAGTGREAVDIFDREKIDVAILDIKMPEMDGLEALHEMRSISDDFEAIILTGYGDEASAIQALRDGAMNFLKKPVDIDQLILSAQKALEKLRSARSLKYRTRELQLATQVIGRITKENKLFVDLRRSVPQATLEFALQLLDAIPIGLLGVDQDMNVLYMNRSCTQPFGCQPEKVDEEFLRKLATIGIKDLTLEFFKSTVDRIAGASIGTIETISTGNYAYISLVPLKVSRESGEQNVVMIILRGERE